ncbi:MAG: EMC3/TMCO1 family protein [Candidatus Woesearchaeota archaeon]
MVFESIGNAMDFALSPLLSLPPFWAIMVVALVLSILITIIYKYTTNQKELKNIREETKTIQNEMKAAKGDMQKMTELNQRLLKMTSQQMKHTLKSYIFTFLPVILIFGWLQGHIAYYPIMPSEQFTTTVVFKEGASAENITLSAPGLEMLSPAAQEISDNKVVWKLKGDAGGYSLEYTYGKEIYLRDVIISKEWKYANAAPNKGIPKESSVNSITVNLKPVHPFGFSIFGWQPGWFATYFILTMLFTFPLRKVLKVY